MRLIIFIVSAILSYAQFFSQNIEDYNLCINKPSTTRNVYFIIGIDNPLNVVYPQSLQIRHDDIAVEFQHFNSKNKYPLEIKEKNGRFYIRPDSLGRIKISVNTIDGIKEIKGIKTKYLTAYFSLLGSKNEYSMNEEIGLYVKDLEDSFKAQEFRKSNGVNANPKDFSGICIIDSFEIIRIDKFNGVTRVTNIGGKFIKASSELISKATSGDLFIFRRILYKCPGNILQNFLTTSQNFNLQYH